MQKAAVARMGITTPTPDVETLARTCMDLKQAVEQMQGRYDEPGIGGSPRLTVDEQPPKFAANGDFWLSTGLANVLSIYLNNKWYKVGALTP